MSKYHNMASEILEAIGGSENVASYTNCMTRLRITPVNRSKINEEAVKKLTEFLELLMMKRIKLFLGRVLLQK